MWIVIFLACDIHHISFGHDKVCGRCLSLLWKVWLSFRISIFFIWYIEIYTQGGKSWQPFGEGKIAHKNFRLARICYFCDKYVSFARNCKFANNSIQYNMQYTPCYSGFLAQGICSALFCPKFPKNTVIATHLNIATK